MVKKLAIALVAVFSLLGVASAYQVGQQAVVDYQNFKKIVLWVAQKQALEEQQRQRQQQQAAKAATPPAAPAPVAEAAKDAPR